MDAELEAVPGIQDVLERWQGPKAVASSSSLRRLQEKLSQTGLARYFHPHVYSGEQVQNGKPAPDLFLFAADRLDLSPDRCLVIEDSANGVRAAAAAGMTVWGFTGGGHADAGLASRLSDAGAAQVVPDHAALKALLTG